MIADQTYSIGELVYGKIKGYPWWPGTIVDMTSSDGRYTIRFFGDNTQAKLNGKQICPFNENETNKIIRNNKNKKLLNAINQAVLLKDKGKGQMASKKKKGNKEKDRGKGKESKKCKAKKSNDTEEQEPEPDALIQNTESLINIEEDKDKSTLHFDFEELLHLDKECDKEDTDSISMLNKKCNREDEDTTSSNKEDLFPIIINYLFCLTTQYLTKTKCTINKEEKKCLTNILQYLKTIELDTSIIKSSQIDVLVLHLINNIKDEELVALATECYKHIMDQYVNYNTDELISESNIDQSDFFFENMNMNEYMI